MGSNVSVRGHVLQANKIQPLFSPSRFQKTGLVLAALAVFCLGFCPPLVAGCAQGNCRNGEGVFNFPGQGVYRGGFLDGKFHGKGQMTHNDGVRYSGRFENGLLEGWGTMSTPEGFYAGEFKKGMPDGRGSMVHKDGTKYEGMFEDGLPQGHGVKTLPDGRLLEGNWDKGEFYRPVTRTHPMPNLAHLISGGLIATYHCPSHCRHCLYNSGPKRRKRFMTPDTARNLLNRVKKMGCRRVHVGGGEPLTHPESVAGILAAAAKEKVAVEYVETNCAWHADTDATRETLKDLKQAGLACLLVSISPFHNNFIPFARTKAVMALAREAGIQVFPWVSSFLTDLAVLDETRPHPMQAFEKEFGPGYAADTPRRYWIHPGGRALDFLRPHVPRP